MQKPDDDEGANGAHTMGEQLTRGAPASWGPIAPDGGPTPAAANPPVSPAREYSPRNVPCLRDCRHYFNCVTHLDHGVPSGILDAEPLQHHHICKAIPGVYLELSADSPVYECKHWDPVSAIAKQQVDKRRVKYYEENPEHKPVAAELSELDESDLEDKEDDNDDTTGTTD